MLIRKFTVFFFILGILLIVSFLIYKNFFYNNEIVQPANNTDPLRQSWDLVSTTTKLSLNKVRGIHNVLAF